MISPFGKYNNSSIRPAFCLKTFILNYVWLSFLINSFWSNIETVGEDDWIRATSTSYFP